MYETQLLEDVGAQARHAAAQAIWMQWVAVGSMAAPASSRLAESMIDPEALVLTSLYLIEEERRLADLASWWARVGANLISVQRLRTVSDRFPRGSGQNAFEQFARLALNTGDKRWEDHAASSLPWASRTEKGPRELALVHPSTLWLRLRAGFGVGAKADALAFLLGIRGARASVKIIATATGYSDVSIRKALSEMALAGLVRETRGRPAEYSTPNRDWARMLSLHVLGEGPDTEPEVPQWRYWADIFAFLAHVAEWSRQQESPMSSGPRVLASRARDILEEFRRPFAINEIVVPDPTRFYGVDAVQCLVTTTETVSDWVTSHV